jgi:hypothetical protein
MQPQTFADLPFWEFETVDTSTNLYKIVGRRTTGNLVERNGEFPDQVVEEARGDAIEIERRLQRGQD